MSIFPSQQPQAQSPIIENDDEISLSLVRGNLEIDIAFQKKEKTLEVAAYDLESGDAAPLPIPFVLSPEELERRLVLSAAIAAYKAA
ncbi:hypothetical protein ccbrp13_56190 [Ktedonobacteria bacterium brp13]|nr:hypothetical protein ccbrp13_56190 [Ktedonobacteria bacterium brp13]